MNENWKQDLAAMHECAAVARWARTQQDPIEAWKGCPRADWMVWLQGWAAIPHGGESHRKLVRCVCRCLLSVLYEFPPATWPHQSVCTTEGWAAWPVTDTTPDLEQVMRDARTAQGLAGSGYHHCLSMSAVYAADYARSAHPNDAGAALYSAEAAINLCAIRAGGSYFPTMGGTMKDHVLDTYPAPPDVGVCRAAIEKMWKGSPA